MVDIVWRLMAAILIISEIKSADITAIQFNDETGYSFKYQILNDETWYEIDLGPKYRKKLEMTLRTIAFRVPESV